MILEAADTEDAREADFVSMLLWPYFEIISLSTWNSLVFTA